MGCQMSDCLIEPFNYRANAQNAALQHGAALQAQRTMRMSLAMQSIYGLAVMSPVMSATMMYTNDVGAGRSQDMLEPAEIKRLCFGALNSGKNIRDLKFDFGSHRASGSLTEDEVIAIESEWEAEKVCKEVKSRYELYDWVAKNEVDAIAPGWKE